MNDLPEDERERNAIIARQQMRERAESIVRDERRYRLTGRELWLTQLSPDGRLLVRIALYCAIIVLLGFCTFRGLIGGSTTSWNQRLTVIVDHLMPGDGRISDIPFAMTLAHGDFLAAPP